MFPRDTSFDSFMSVTIQSTMMQYFQTKLAEASLRHHCHSQVANAAREPLNRFVWLTASFCGCRIGSSVCRICPSTSLFEMVALLSASSNPSLANLMVAGGLETARCRNGPVAFLLQMQYTLQTPHVCSKYFVGNTSCQQRRLWLEKNSLQP